jgi:alpha-1,4-digalacturonate transport system substrate-binding protein
MAQNAPIELRYMCYADANECEVARDLLDRFERANPGIRVVVDKVGFNVIREQLETRLQSGQGPDMARVTSLPGLNRYYLDLRPYVDASYWETNFGPTLQWMRVGPGDRGIYGFLTQLTISGAIVNASMFAEAGVNMPGAGATWDDWAAALRQVRQKLNLYSGMAMDRSGHRFAGPAMSYGARYLDAQGRAAVIDEGFRAFAERFVAWHREGLMPPDIWPAVSGARWRNAADMFVNRETAMHISGSWMVQRYAEVIGDRFEWVVVPSPCGTAGCAAMPGGAAMVAFKHTRHPEAVGRVMAFMTSEPILKEYYERTLQIPAHVGLARAGLNYGAGVPQSAVDALRAFLANYQQVPPQAHQLQGYERNAVVFNATANFISQAITGAISLDEAFRRIAEEVKQAGG